MKVVAFIHYIANILKPNNSFVQEIKSKLFAKKKRYGHHSFSLYGKDQLNDQL